MIKALFAQDSPAKATSILAYDLARDEELVLSYGVNMGKVYKQVHEKPALDTHFINKPGDAEAFSQKLIASRKKEVMSGLSLSPNRISHQKPSEWASRSEDGSEDFRTYFLAKTYYYFRVTISKSGSSALMLSTLGNHGVVEFDLALLGSLEVVFSRLEGDVVLDVLYQPIENPEERTLILLDIEKLDGIGLLNLPRGSRLDLLEQLFFHQKHLNIGTIQAMMAEEGDFRKADLLDEELLEVAFESKTHLLGLSLKSDPTIMWIQPQTRMTGRVLSKGELSSVHCSKYHIGLECRETNNEVVACFLYSDEELELDSIISFDALLPLDIKLGDTLSLKEGVQLVAKDIQADYVSDLTYPDMSNLHAF